MMIDDFVFRFLWRCPNCYRMNEEPSKITRGDLLICEGCFFEVEPEDLEDEFIVEGNIGYPPRPVSSSDVTKIIYEDYQKAQKAINSNKKKKRKKDG